MRKVIPIVLAAAVLLLQAACGRPASDLPGEPRPAVSFSTLELSSTDEPAPAEPASVATVGVPPGLPPDFPLPAGTVGASQVIDAEEGTSFTVAVDAASRPAAAADAYASALRAEGYSVDTLSEEVGPVTVSFTRGGEREQGAAVFEPAGPGTRASVTLTVAD